MKYIKILLINILLLDYVFAKEINVNDFIGGKIITANKAEIGEKVKLEIEHDEDYVIDNINIVDSLGNEIEVNNNSFIMPDNDVYVYGSARKYFNIKIINNDNVNILINKTSALENELVNVFTSSIRNNVNSRLNVYDENYNKIKVINNSFRMPSSNVIISASINNNIKEESKIEIVSKYISVILIIGIMIIILIKGLKEEIN